MKTTLRWKKNPRPTGLAGVCCGNPGHSLNMGGEKYATAYEHDPRYSNKRGWWWCARGPEVPLYNSWNDEPLTEDGAKSAAMDYVKKSLTNASVEVRLVLALTNPSTTPKKMKAIILYSQETPSPEHQMMHVVREKDSTTLYVRAEIVDDDPDFALDKAAPREGEIVLNSVPFPGENAQMDAPNA